MMNKKAFIADWIVDMWALLVFMLILVFFYFLFTGIFAGIGKVQGLQVYDIPPEKTYLETTTSNFLRTPVELDGKEINYAELIAYCINKNDFDILKQKIDGKFGFDDYYWELTIYDGETEKLIKRIYREGYCSNILIPPYTIIPDKEKTKQIGIIFLHVIGEKQGKCLRDLDILGP